MELSNRFAPPRYVDDDNFSSNLPAAEEAPETAPVVFPEVDWLEDDVGRFFNGRQPLFSGKKFCFHFGVAAFVFLTFLAIWEVVAYNPGVYTLLDAQTQLNGSQYQPGEQSPAVRPFVAGAGVAALSLPSNIIMSRSLMQYFIDGACCRKRPHSARQTGMDILYFLLASPLALFPILNYTWINTAGDLSSLISSIVVFAGAPYATLLTIQAFQGFKS